MADSENKNTIKNSTAGRDLIAGNQDNTTITNYDQCNIDNHTGDRHTHFNVALPERKGSLKAAIEAIESEKENNEDFNHYLEVLFHFINPRKGEQKDLKMKLEESGRAYLVEDAELLKERFTKIIMRSSFSETAQFAYAQILSKIRTAFMTLVMPMIKQKGISIKEVEEVVFHSIIEQIHFEIGGTSYAHTTEDIRGMLYFLTGNCHIEWV